MKRTATIKDGLTNKISFYHLALFVAALPFDQFYSQLVFISFLLHTLIHAKPEHLKNLRNKQVWILASLFFLSVVCTIYSNNKPEAYSLWMRQLTILLFPVVLSINAIDLKKYADKILLTFAFTCTAVVSYLFLDAIRIIAYNHLPLTNLFSPAFTNHNFSAPIDLHATYLSMYVVLSIAVLFVQTLKQKGRIAKVFIAVCMFVLLAGLIQLGSRAAMIAFLLIVNIVFPFAVTKTSRLVFFVASISLTTILCLFIINNSSFKMRFLNELKTDLAVGSEMHITDSRMERWDVAFELVKEAPLTGYGTGEEKVLLKEKYFQNKLYDAYLNNLNAHNQYISFLLMGGMLALLVYLLTLGYGLKRAILSDNIILISFLVLLIVVSFSENFLERNKGIFFYAFFFSFFMCMEKRRNIAANKPPKLSKANGNQLLTRYVYIK